MNRKGVITLLLAVFLAIFFYFSIREIAPEEIENEPDWVSLSEAFDRAVADEKLILVDIFEVGCKFCRKMTREVYPAPSTRAVIDRGFHPVKVNGNSEDPVIFRGDEMTSAEFAALMGVTAYPFTVILDSEGTVLARQRGYMGVQNLTQFMRDALNERQM